MKYKMFKTKNQEKFHTFLYSDLMSLSPKPGTDLVDFINDLQDRFDRLEAIFADYKHSFGLNNIRSFVEDKRKELMSLKQEIIDECLGGVGLLSFDFFFVSGGICVGKTTLIKNLMSDEEISRNAVMIIEPIEYWYSDKERRFDDTLALFAFKDLQSNTDISEFPFSEFFISTWLLNILMNFIRASMSNKTLLLIERDYSDEYLLQRYPIDSFLDSFPCFESLRTNFGCFVLLRYITKSSLLDIMRINLPLRGTSELGFLDHPDYVKFIDEYHYGFKAVSTKFAFGPYPKLIAREYFIDRYASESIDEVKSLISSVKKRREL